MKKLKLLTALGMGIMASSSGMIQTQAALYTFSVDFSDKEVLDFNDFRPTFNINTNNLTGKLTTRFAGTYFFDSCTTNLNVAYEQFARGNGTGAFYSEAFIELPDFTCTTTPTTYTATATVPFPAAAINFLMSDDDNFLQLSGTYFFRQTAATNGRVLNLRNFITSYTIQYDFGTTYLFNYFLSDTQFQQTLTSGSWSLGSNREIKVNYVYTTAGNDEYRLINSDFLENLGTNRKKYAIDYNEEFFRGESVGLNISVNRQTDAPYTVDRLTLASSGNASLRDQYRVYYLNVSNVAQQIVDAPIFEFEEEDCGSFLALNVGCFINNAFAYITNDAPIVSDAFTLLNAGIEMAAQTFGIIGEFADDNVFGVLILAGFGFIAVKWFLKND
jgi:hypothetical protein